MFFSLILFSASEDPLCSDVEPFQMICENNNCKLDELVEADCKVFPPVVCKGARSFKKKVTCRYCYQLPKEDMICDTLTNCHPSIDNFFTDCRANNTCIGNSVFQRKTVCKAAEKSQKTAFLLSLFLGGLAADRFYLGYYVIGAFKLITLGGLGIAYMADLFLILFGYLGPASGKLFLERV